MSEEKKPPQSGTYKDYATRLAEIEDFYRRKKRKLRSDPIRSDPIRSDPIQSDPIRSDPIRSDPKGVSLYLEKKGGQYYLGLQFVDPVTNKRVKRAAGIDTFTEESIIEAIQKAHKVVEALKTITPNEFWSWYDCEIFNISEKLKSLTYRYIFKDIEDEYFAGSHHNVRSGE